MDHLLVVASVEGIPESILQPLRLDGWRITVTADILWAKHLLRNSTVAAVMIAMKADHDVERLKILRFVHEFCPNTMLIMLHSHANAVVYTDGTKLAHTLDQLGDACVLEGGAKTVDLWHLSPAQRRIAELVGKGYPNREIANNLGLKEQSVRNELSRIFKKLGIWNRVELALLLQNRQRLIPEASMDPWKIPVEPIAGAGQKVPSSATV